MKQIKNHKRDRQVAQLSEWII